MSDTQLFPKILSYLNHQINACSYCSSPHRSVPSKPLHWSKAGALHRISFVKYIEALGGVPWKIQTVLSHCSALHAHLPRTRQCVVYTLQNSVWHKTHLSPCPTMLQCPWWVAGHTPGIKRFSPGSEKARNQSAVSQSWDKISHSVTSQTVSCWAPLTFTVLQHQIIWTQNNLLGFISFNSSLQFCNECFINLRHPRANINV